MIIVTGSNGFIGANLVAALRDAHPGTPILGVDHYAEDGTRYPAHAAVDHELGLDEFIEAMQTSALPATPIAIYHLGACSDTTVTDRDHVTRVNLDFSKTVWRYCVEQSVPLVYASSAATYGDGSQGYSDEADPKIYEPLNLYAESKHLFDLWALDQTRQGIAPPHWAGVKYFNVYGPMESHKGRMASMGFHWVNQVRDTGVTKLFKSYRDGYADGQQQRDFIYVADAVAATMHLMRGDQPGGSPGEHPGGLYNIGTGVARPFADLATACFTAVGREPKLEYIDMPESLRPQYQYFTQATVDKLRGAGFDTPMRNLTDGMADYVEWRRANDGLTI
ncbi:MAG: ADP-glyceromanno-heptose 6-epimerase [Planctomycetota bacterium]